MGQRDPREHLDDVARLGRVGLQEGAADRRVEEQVADLDHRPLRPGALADRPEAARVDGDLRAMRRVGRSGLAAGPRNLGDRREGFTPEAQSADSEQVLRLG